MYSDDLHAIVFQDEMKMDGVESGGMRIKDVGREALVLSTRGRNEEAEKQPEADHVTSSEGLLLLVFSQGLFFSHVHASAFELLAHLGHVATVHLSLRVRFVFFQRALPLRDGLANLTLL